MLRLFEDLSPHARVATAIMPFVLAVLLRIVFGKNKMTRTLISIGTVWFVANVLLAPYSARMRQDLQRLEYVIR